VLAVVAPFLQLFVFAVPTGRVWSVDGWGGSAPPSDPTSRTSRTRRCEPVEASLLFHSGDRL
jgi:hypothetical protein